LAKPSHEDRTEQPTPRRREEARKEGQVARSADLNAALGLIVGLMILESSFSFLGQTVANFMVTGIGGLGSADVSQVGAMSLLMEGMITFLIAAAPVALGAMLVGLVVNVAQVGFMFSPKLLVPKFSRIDPISGFGRIFSKEALVGLLKSAVKAVAIGYSGYLALRTMIPQITMASYMAIDEGLATAADAGIYVVKQMSVLFVVIGVADYAYQRMELERNLRMTKQELKEEIRQQEGDPMVKSRIRQRQRQIAMRRMMEDVKTADVVVVNPTEYAVALKYDQERMNAPVVVAKGQRLIAQRIREVAEEAGVPVVPNPPVARAIFSAVEIGQEIPPELYRAVAEILAFVYRLSKAR